MKRRVRVQIKSTADQCGSWGLPASAMLNEDKSANASNFKSKIVFGMMDDIESRRGLVIAIWYKLPPTGRILSRP